MISAAIDCHGLESRHHYDLSGKVLDINLERLGRVFEALRLERFGTFEEFTQDPDLFYFRASARGDFWEQ